MYVSMNWIKDFIDLDGFDDDELINKFTMSTAEVEKITHYGKDTCGVVVGKIISVDNIDNSSKLHKVIVDIGNEKIQSICGASNVIVGKLIAFAKAGSLVKGIKVKETTIQGLASCGVCLSEKELGISDHHDGLLFFDTEYKLGTDVKEIIPIDDTVFEIDNKSLTNRPDLWGHYGIAREFSAITKRPLKKLPVCDLSIYDKLPKIDVDVKSQLCYRYSSIGIENITKHESSFKMKTRLYYTGSRAINLLADITNYIMLELGQPMHAFDKQLINKIIVKQIDHDISFKTLDSNIRVVPKDTLMICDSEKPVAIAGIMGGENTEITKSTNSLLLESATFDTVAIRKTSTKLGLKTDSSQRYEKTLDPELTKVAIKRYLTLLKEIDSGVQVVSCFTDVYNKKYEEITLKVPYDYILRRIGVDIHKSFIIETLTHLGFNVTEMGNIFNITVPSFRATKDITNKADIVEEIARMYGYDKIVPKTTLFELLPVKQDIKITSEYNTKLLLATKFGLNEVHSYIWYNTKLNEELSIKTEPNIRIINALNEEDDTLRNTIIPTLLNITFNNMKVFEECNIFEIGRVFDYNKDDNLVYEKKVLGIVLCNLKAKEEDMLFNMKNIIENVVKFNNNINISVINGTDVKESFIHPVNSYSVMYNKTRLGYIALVHPKIKNTINKKASIVVCEISMDELNSIKKKEAKYLKYTKQQTVNIDLSLTVNNDYSYSNIESIIKETDIKYLIDYKFISIYEDTLKLGDKKTITLRFNLGDFTKTLTSEEINDSINTLIAAFEAQKIEIRK